MEGCTCRNHRTSTNRHRNESNYRWVLVLNGFRLGYTFLCVPGILWLRHNQSYFVISFDLSLAPHHCRKLGETWYNYLVTKVTYTRPTIGRQLLAELAEVSCTAEALGLGHSPIHSRICPPIFLQKYIALPYKTYYMVVGLHARLVCIVATRIQTR